MTAVLNSTMRPEMLRGRGALSNHAGRYEKQTRVLVDDGWDDGWRAEDGAPPALRTEVIHDATRSIIADGWFARFMCFTLLHEPYHGVHHWKSGLPHPELPLNADVLEPRIPGEMPPFTSYRAALWDLIINLGDPRVGAQWNGGRMQSRKEVVQQGLN